MTDQALTDCRGYGVVMHDGRVGTVAAVLALAYGREGGLLLVRTGPTPDCGLSAMSFDEVEGVDAEGRRIVLKAQPD
jgi:hypothetical protein